MKFPRSTIISPLLIMAPRTKINISLLALTGTIILFVIGIQQRRANSDLSKIPEAGANARRRVVFVVEDLLLFAAQTPSGTFPADLIPADLEERSSASWYFAKDEACWSTLQKEAKENLDKPIFFPYREPSQPEAMLVYIEFDSEKTVTLKFVQDSLVDCDY